MKCPDRIFESASSWVSKGNRSSRHLTTTTEEPTYRDEYIKCTEINGMLAPQELSAIRFAMSAPPQPGGEPGFYEEQVAQWVAEKSFFRDFVYRNAKGKKKGDQLVDGIVLFG